MKRLHVRMFYVLQKPLSMSRNPFKKTPTSSGKVMRNTFKHLTDTAIGFDSQATQDLEFEPVFASTEDIEKENQNHRNNTQTLDVSFHFLRFSAIM